MNDLMKIHLSPKNAETLFCINIKIPEITSVPTFRESDAILWKYNWSHKLIVGFELLKTSGTSFAQNSES